LDANNGWGKRFEVPETIASMVNVERRGGKNYKRKSRIPYILNGKDRMGEVEQFGRNDRALTEDYRHDSGRNGLSRNDPNPFDTALPPTSRDIAQRAVGSPLPVGSTGKTPVPISQVENHARIAAPPPGRALSGPQRTDGEQSSGMQWAMSALKQAVPFMQRLLPLIDGNIATAVSNLLTSHPHPPPPPPRVDLQPLESGLTELQIQHRDLRAQIVEQSTTFKRVEDQLEMVREATDRNTLEQQELIEDLKAIGNRVNLLALLLLGMLVVSVLLNLFLFLHIQRVLP
jgi:hypothetical protein